MKMRRLGDWQGLRFYSAVGFLIWSLLPHFHLGQHAHAGDGPGHSHTPAEWAAEAAAPVPPRVLSGAGPAWADAGAAFHLHYWEDANVTGMAADFPPLAQAFFLALLLAALPAVHRLFPHFAWQARAPPSFRIA